MPFASSSGAITVIGLQQKLLKICVAFVSLSRTNNSERSTGADFPRAAFDESRMSFRINDTAPDFTAETNHGTISFHDWIGDGWAVLFSHPRTSRQCTRPSWEQWPASRPSSRGGASRSSVFRSIPFRIMQGGRRTSRVWRGVRPRRRIGLVNRGEPQHSHRR